jgi:hypothetical protein
VDKKEFHSLQHLLQLETEAREILLHKEAATEKQKIRITMRGTTIFS